MLGEGLLSLCFGLLFLPGETQTAIRGGTAGSWPGGKVVGSGGCQRSGGRRCGSSSMFCELEGRWGSSVTNRHVVVVVHAIFRFLRCLIGLLGLVMIWYRSGIELNMVFFSSKANFMYSLL